MHSARSLAMKLIFAIILAYATTAAAQSVNGLSLIPAASVHAYEEAYWATASPAAGAWSNSEPTQTPTPSATTQASASQYTPPPSADGGWSMMPYSSFMSGGYSSMACGYGYIKASDGLCKSASWVATRQL